MKHTITALLCALFSTICFAENKVTVIEYCPAPGQFINTLPIIESEDDVLQKAQQNLERGSMISLGAFGG